MATSMLQLFSFVCLPVLSSATVSHSRLRLRSVASRNVRGQGLVESRTRKTRAAVRAAGVPEQVEDWQDSAQAIQSSLSDTDLMQLSAQITPSVYSAQLHAVADPVQSRFVINKGNNQTAEYVRAQFNAMNLDVALQTMKDARIRSQYYSASLLSEYADSTHVNVMGFRQGTDLANEVVILGAHYDSVNWEDTQGKAPGVDDNGSGTALMLAVAKILSSSTFTPRRSILFVAFNAEEEGLVGSQHFVKLFSQGADGLLKFGHPKAVFIVDEVAYPGRGHERRAIFETVGHGDGTTAMVDTLAHLAYLKNSTTAQGGDGLGDGTQNFMVNYHGFGSDHISFLDEGFPAVLIIERDDDYHSDMWGHSDRDTFQHVDTDFGAAMSRLALRAVASFATPA